MFGFLPSLESTFHPTIRAGAERLQTVLRNIRVLNDFDCVDYVETVLLAKKKKLLMQSSFWSVGIVYSFVVFG